VHWREAHPDESFVGDNTNKGKSLPDLHRLLSSFSDEKKV